MYIDIVRTPEGEAPLWVRQAWVGLRLPSALKRARTWPGQGVVTGPKTFAGRLWGRLMGRGTAISGYAVGSREAVDLLAAVNPAAADWWRQNAPQFLGEGLSFVFDAPACREVTSVMTASPPS
ncbi:MAG TPA: hypothetical protein VG166_03340 [Caulobacteraceae bacterium]|jgi:hypothetical protein|nr:hypothetical protein [Caulobacteraceae bacterium]